MGVANNYTLYLDDIHVLCFRGYSEFIGAKYTSTDTNHYDGYQYNGHSSNNASNCELQRKNNYTMSIIIIIQCIYYQ